MSKFRLAIIGATGTALARTIPALRYSDVCEVVAIQGRDLEKLAAVERDFGIGRCYLGRDEMLDSGEYDAVYIATPPFMHLEDIRQCVLRGKPVICEKPLARDYAEAERVAQLLSDHPDLPFMVAHHLRHQKAFADIKTLIAAGEIGLVTHVWCQWGFFLNTAASNALWKLDPKLGGAGTFSDNGIHIVDLMIALFGLPEGVFGHSMRMRLPATYDNGSAMMRYRDKSVVLNSSQSMPAAGNHLLIYGTDGKIEAFGAMGERYIAQVSIAGKAGLRELPYPEENLYRNEVEDFLAYYLLGKRDVDPGTSIREAVWGMSVVELIRRSAGNGKYLRLEERP